MSWRECPGTGEGVSILGTGEGVSVLGEVRE